MSGPLRAAVAHELERMCAPGGALDPLGPRSSVAGDRAVVMRRALDVATEFLALQTHVEVGGLMAIVTAGPPGAGKSTWLEHEGRVNGYRVIDPDVIKDALLRSLATHGDFDDLYRHLLPDGAPIRPRELAGLVHAESVAISHTILQTSLKRGENIAIQGTLGWTEQPNRILHDADTHGYANLTIVDVEVDRETALARSLERWWVGRINANDPLGGRFVPRRVINGLFTDQGPSICQANALYLFERSALESTTLVTIDGATLSESVRHKIDGEEVPASVDRTRTS
ncbi:MAG: zeta toxin family protein [Pseudolysinimonas sp.]